MLENELRLSMLCFSTSYQRMHGALWLSDGCLVVR